MAVIHQWVGRGGSYPLVAVAPRRDNAISIARHSGIIRLGASRRGSDVRFNLR